MRKEDFWTRVDRRGDEECWPWLRGTNNGYGVVRVGDGKTSKAHRVAYELIVGPIPEGLTIDHLCRNRGCQNPKHMQVVTQSENSRRAMEPYRVAPCKNGHARPPGKRCPRCAYAAVLRTMAKYPEKYREMRRLQKAKERARDGKS